MDLNKIIRELQDERQRLDQIVASLEQLQITKGIAIPPPEPKRGRRSMDPAARLEVSKRMKRYWDKKRRNSTS